VTAIATPRRQSPFICTIVPVDIREEWIEFAASYLDALAACDGALLAKEASAGVGAGLTMLAARFFPGLARAYAIGAVGAT
jgi:hypothetical protein